MAMRWTADRLDQLEHAVRHRLRVAVNRRGTEYVVVATDLITQGRREGFRGLLPMTGEELEFALGDLESFEVLER